MKFNKVIDEVCRNDSNNQNIQEILQSIIYTIDHAGENILFYARQASDVERLISKGAHVNIVNHNGENVLFQHVREKNNDIVKIFIDKGTSYDLVNNVGDNLLSIACRFANIEMITYFIDKGLTLNKEQSKAVFYKIAENCQRFSFISSSFLISISCLLLFIFHSGISYVYISGKSFFPLFKQALRKLFKLKS